MINQISLIDLNKISDFAYDVSSGNAVFSCKLTTKAISFTISATGLTGTLDATAQIYGANTNDIDKAVQVGTTITLSTAIYNELIVKDIWNSAYLFVKLTVNNCTGGSLEIPLTLK